MCEISDEELNAIKQLINTDHTKPPIPNRQNAFPSPSHCKTGKTVAWRRICKCAMIGGIMGVLILCAILFCLQNTDERDAGNVDLTGHWRYDQYTEYVFEENGIGCLRLDENCHYDFTYMTEGDKLYIQFVPEYVNDCQYTYAIAYDQLTLIGGSGTSEIGKVYLLLRIQPD